MQNMDQAMQEALRLSQTDAGQQLLAMLNQKGGEELRQAMEKAASGDYSMAKQALSSLMNAPEMKKLLDQLGR